MILISGLEILFDLQSHWSKGRVQSRKSINEWKFPFRIMTPQIKWNFHSFYFFFNWMASLLEALSWRLCQSDKFVSLVGNWGELV